ncbi:hypothetical protein HH308_05055 [Gordonia sp. TBRC 11910]|uniref:Homeodomain-like domain-containing protein n=1 Tax=Gordonia asplenii TaxID=2725283 RepID=A0A848KQR8_9ACTN|nr:hypothetical protein [Gordonia asplenii]NMO00582.1 hypothetical protein [Gordonia asplenii]
MEGSARASGVRPADVEVEIRRMHDQGATQGETARALGVSPASLSRWSKRAGLFWGIPPRVEFARAERLRAARAQLAEEALADALELRKRLWDKVTEHVVTADGVEKVIHDLPSARAVRDLASAIERLSRISDHESVGATNDAVSMVDALTVQLREWKEANP